MTGERERLSASDASNVVMDSPDQVNVPLVVGVLGVGGFVSAGGEVDVDLASRRHQRGPTPLGEPGRAA